jgi:hypothetical protein
MAEESDVEVKFGASIEGLTAGIEEAKEQLEGLTEPISGILDSFKELGEAALVAFAFEQISEFAEKMGELGEQTERTAKILGISSEQVGELNFAAAMTGTSTDNLTMMMGRFEAGLPEAVAGTGRMAAGLKALGLNARELQGIPLPEQLNKIADATARFADGANKTAALQSLGRGFAELIPLLDEGSKGMDELNEKAKEAGVVLGDELRDRLVDMQHAMVDMRQTISGLSIAGFEPFINVVNGAVAIITDLAHSMMESAREGGALHEILAGLANVFQNVEDFIVGLIQLFRDMYIDANASVTAIAIAFDGLGKTIDDVFVSLGNAIPGFFTALLQAGAEAVKAIEKQFLDLGTVINDTLHLDFGGAKAAFGAMGDDAAASAAKISGAFTNVFKPADVDGDLKETSAKIDKVLAERQKRLQEAATLAEKEYARIWGANAAPKEEGGDKKQVPNLQQSKGGNEALKAAEAEANAEIEIEKATATQKTKLLDDELKEKQISMGQWLTQTKSVLKEELDAETATYEKELQTAGLTSAQKIAIKAKETKAIIEYNTQIQQAEAKAAEASQKEWDSATKQINSAFTSQIDGLLKGTTNWATALKNVLATLTEDVIKFFAEWALKAVENQALQIASQNSITSGILSAMGLQAAGQAAASKPGIIAQIGADTGEAYAGFAAFLAPILGPAAPAAAAGLSAQVSSTALGLASFDVGSWELPHDQLAMVHAGEMIVPSRGGVADEFRAMASGGGGGGSTTHNHTYNINGARDPHQIAREVANVWQSNPSLRPRGY